MQNEQLRRHALEIFGAALRAADPKVSIRVKLQLSDNQLLIDHAQWDLSRARRILVLGAGKASANMAKAVEEVLGDRITDGLINTKYGHSTSLRRIQLNECGHPVPDQAGVRGAREILDLAQAAGAYDIVIVLVSGGASALLPLPAEGLTLADKQATTSLLLACGATIHEINAVRKHLSAIKGGRLAAAAAPAHVISLILSDVVGDDLDVIGSGITAPDRSTFADALAVLDKYGLRARVPGAVRHHLEAGRAETPKPDDPAFARTRNIIVGSNRIALEAGADKAVELGYAPLIVSSVIEGEAREVAIVETAIAKEVRTSGNPIAPPACLLFGGETTVNLRGSGKGGRNQELALAAAVRIAGRDGIAVLSGGTDGTDGPTDAAGGVVDSATANSDATRAAALEALANNNSYECLDAMGSLVRTGPTGTNVADVQVILVR